MEIQSNKQKQDFELRSEKVRKIIGQIPPILMRYEITTISFIIIVFSSISIILPYKQIVSGTLVIDKLLTMTNDSISFNAKLKLPDKFSFSNNNLNKLLLITPDSIYQGHIIEYSPLKNIDGQYEITLRVPTININKLQNSTLDFKLIIYKSTVFKQIWHFVKP